MFLNYIGNVLFPLTKLCASWEQGLLLPAETNSFNIAGTSEIVIEY